MRSSERALTLLEVLAAVAILGILYTALATKAIEGIHNEGNSRRRLEASLLADQTLSDLELQIAEGATPPVGKTESEQDDYRVEVSVDPLPLPAALAERRGTADPATPSLLGAGDGNADPSTDLLRRIEVDVIWPDGVFERQVRRVTYAYDVAGVQALTGPPASAGGTPGAGGVPQAPPSPTDGSPGSTSLPSPSSFPGIPGEAGS
jgi:prepilin-type N-terminal cleavage/methylation domain-containing protein